MGRAARRRTAGLPVPHRNTKDTPFPTWPQIQERGGAKTQAQRPHAQGPQARALTALASVSSSALLALFLSFSVSLLASPVLPLHFLSLLLSLLSPTCLCLSACVSLPPGLDAFLGASARRDPDPTAPRRRGAQAGLGRSARASRQRGGRGRRVASAGPGTSEGGESSLLAKTRGAGPLEACGAVACGAPPAGGGRACRLP